MLLIFVIPAKEGIYIILTIQFYRFLIGAINERVFLLLLTNYLSEIQLFQKFYFLCDRFQDRINLRFKNLFFDKKHLEVLL